MDEIVDSLGESERQWQTVFARLHVKAPEGATLRACTPASRPDLLRPLVTLGQSPLHLYLQDSRSALFATRSIAGPEKPDFAALVATAMGISLRVELNPEGPHPAAASALPRNLRLCHGFVRLNVHLGHPRYAALHRAEMLCTPASRQLAYANLEPRLQAACDGQLDETQAAQLADDWIAQALCLAGCESVEIDARVHQVLQLCDRRPVLRMSDVAGELNLSASRLSHLFSEYTGFSFRQYLLLARTLHAWEQVAFSKELSLTEIAHAKGFSDLAHMSRAFQLLFSYPPSFVRDSRRWCLRGAPSAPGSRIPPRWAAH